MSSPGHKVCVIGAGPSGMSALYHFGKMQSGDAPQVICYEKQSTWGGLWNFSWRTGTDKFGERCHAGMYKHLWANQPKECAEFPDYTFEEHFGKAIPSYLPRAVLRDYLEGRWTKNSKTDLCHFIKFNSVVRFVRYNEVSDDFTVTVHDLTTDVARDETFSHVIVAVGIFNVPDSPDIPGIENFQGRAIHSHDFRDAREFKGQRLLAVGAHYSAEDVALQCLKFGAKQIVCTWKTNPMGFKWPKGIEERPPVQKMDGNTAHFKDGSTAEIDAIIFCTGYRYKFPFMEESLRLKSKRSLYPDNLYKGTLWMKGGNTKLFYLGVQDQYYTYTLFEAQALWACKYILGKLPQEPKPLADMEADIKKWANKHESVKGCHQEIDFQTAFLEDLVTEAGYSEEVSKAGALFHTWEEHRAADIATYRDQSFSSIYTGTKSPKQEPWMEAFDDSIEACVQYHYSKNIV